MSLILSLLKDLKQEESMLENSKDRPRVGELIQEIIGRKGIFGL